MDAMTVAARVLASITVAMHIPGITQLHWHSSVNHQALRVRSILASLLMQPSYDAFDSVIDRSAPRLTVVVEDGR